MISVFAQNLSKIFECLPVSMYFVLTFQLSTLFCELILFTNYYNMKETKTVNYMKNIRIVPKMEDSNCCWWVLVSRWVGLWMGRCLSDPLWLLGSFLRGWVGARCWYLVGLKPLGFLEQEPQVTTPYQHVQEAKDLKHNIHNINTIINCLQHNYYKSLYSKMFIFRLIITCSFQYKTFQVNKMCSTITTFMWGLLVYAPPPSRLAIIWNLPCHMNSCVPVYVWLI